MASNGNGRYRTAQIERPSVKTVRCAVYTRKSTDEGLEQDFNSLDAQREAAEAFIASQRHEGWELLADRYDDGGYSGGNLERPALKRLLADIESGRVDCVVVYKVDRLTRSLLDFARMMETFDRIGVNFVSITQQFTSANSLGRLTLHILLSFAQFERELISERTRDKMSAARRKGKWVGGMPVLGYDIDPKGGRLHVNEDEAEQVRQIFALYLKLGSLVPVVGELNRRGWRTKSWTTRDGREHLGAEFTKNALFRMLTNVTYLGQVNHKGTVFPGEHPAIVDRNIWEQVNRQLKRNGMTGGKEVRNRYGALLGGLLYCAPCGCAMSHSYTRKGQRLYRYYVCASAQQKGWASCPSKSLPAQDVEDAIIAKVRALGKDPEIVDEALRRARLEGSEQTDALSAEAQTAERELVRLNRELSKLATASGNGTRLDRMADLQERIRVTEVRLADIQKELNAMPHAGVDAGDLRAALLEFDQVWKSLNTLEQTRLLRAVIERIAFDGRTGKLSIAFKHQALKEVCNA